MRALNRNDYQARSSPAPVAIVRAKRNIAGLLLGLCLLMLCLIMLRAADAPASPPDAEARALLLSADRIEAVAITAHYNGNTTGLAIEPYEKSLGDFPLARLRSSVEDIELIPQPVNPSWGSDTIPSLFLVFYKSKKEIASLSLDYGDSPNTFFSYGEKRILYHLQPKSAFALRKLAARQPQFIKAIVKLGAKTQDMAPQRAYDGVN